VRSSAARPLRFLFVGGITFVLQYGLLKLFEAPGLSPVVAYGLALAVAVQFNFVVSQLLVWPDRPVRITFGDVFRRWLSFLAMIALSLVINFVGFALAQPFMPDLAATVVAVAASTVIKYLSLDRYTFTKTNRLFKPN
jgi:putative flippase GtrA